MKIAILGHHSEFAYSGGRYHSWAMAEALQLANNQITVYTTNQPEFSYDFYDYDGHKNIKLKINKDLNNITPEEDYDLTILIPYLTHDSEYYENALIFTKKANSKLVLMNFESGNWFNEISKFKKDIKLWDGYKKVTKQECLILSSTKISQEYAKTFYGTEDHLKYNYSNPAINNLLADKAQINSNEKSILICSRFSDKHKGGQDIINLFCEELRGCTFKFIIGAGEFNRELWDQFFTKSKEFNIRLKLLKRLDDLSKFEELKSSKALVFPSYFEGFGYPPVEARYCKIPCLAYDLEVLREVNGNEIEYVELGNTDQLKDSLINIINKTNATDYSKSIQTMESFSDELNKILLEYSKRS